MKNIRENYQAPNVSRYRSARLPTSTRHIPTTPESNPLAPTANDSMVRSRSRYHRKTAPKTTVPATSSQPSAGVQSTKQRHLATLAALTGEPFILASDDEDSGTTILQQDERRKLVPHYGYQKGDDRQASPGPMLSHSTRHVDTGADVKHSNRPKVDQNSPELIKAVEQSLSSRLNHTATRASHRQKQKGPQTLENDPGKNSPQYPAGAGALKESMRQAPKQLPKNELPCEHDHHAEGKLRRIGQKQNAPGCMAKENSKGPIFPGTDAPVSAINAGERKVFIKYDGKSVSLPVTPSTTSLDLINSAAKAFTDNIQADSHQLMEFFHQLALERALRSYENVRDVMNSWEGDVDNHLFVVQKAPEAGIGVANIERLPAEAPEASMYLYHSSRPGRWDKRWTILNRDGQILTSKKEGESLTNLCHLSDFDIYSPTRHQKKKIKSPKKICFAIKSQQKSSMFLSGQNFIHFFATSDKDIATNFHQAVCSWRSWYLVNVLGKRRAEPASTRMIQPRARRASIDSSPRSKVLLDQKNAEISTDAANGSSNSKALPRSVTARKSGGTTPPTSFPKGFANDVTDESLDMQPASTTAAIPKRSNSHRQIAPQSRPAPSRSRSNSMTSEIGKFKIGNHSATKSPPKREKPKPLVDLTPVFQEPPQHTRKGRGVTAEPGKQLIDQIGTSDMEPGAILAPSATTWRRPGDAAFVSTIGSSPPQRNGTTHMRGKWSLDERRPFNIPERRGKPLDEEEDPFTGGLLGKLGQQTVTGA